MSVKSAPPANPPSSAKLARIIVILSEAKKLQFSAALNRSLKNLSHLHRALYSGTSGPGAAIRTIVASQGGSLQRKDRFSSRGFGKALLFLVIVLIGIFVVVGYKITRREGPVITLRSQLKGIGQSTEVLLEASDDRHHVKRVDIVLEQGGRPFRVLGKELPVPSSWKFWSKDGQRLVGYSVRAGRKEFPELVEGNATLRITATNDSWGNFFRGGKTEVVMDLPVRFAPPQVQVLSFPQYVNQGGAELVVFKVSPGTTHSGVQVGDLFFPSWPVKESMPETRLCFFAYPWNVDAATPARIHARDDAGNETVSNFTYRVFPKKFRSDKIQISDDFMARVVPPIMSQTPDFQEQGSMLKDFLAINGDLRRANAAELVTLSQKTAPNFLWTQPFVQLGNSKVEAAFADSRTYLYNGQEVDHQTHLGFDLATTAQAPIVAANDGVVVRAAFFGIFGNAVIIDHGCGLQTLYAHLSAIGVKEGDKVKRGQEIGRSGQTGLAGGDHLHFTTLLQGIPINPVEWWDPHWIHDRIEAKLALYR
jgi:murein DD-endopeptidase MepM/ murein hydrolase activator NlpD